MPGWTYRRLSLLVNVTWLNVLSPIKQPNTTSVSLKRLKTQGHNNLSGGSQREAPPLGASRWKSDRKSRWRSRKGNLQVVMDWLPWLILSRPWSLFHLKSCRWVILPISCSPVRHREANPMGKPENSALSPGKPVSVSPKRAWELALREVQYLCDGMKSYFTLIG